MKQFTKQEIQKMILYENKIYSVYNKKDLVLNESNGNAYVEPSSDNASSLSSDLSKAKSKNPNDNEFIVNANSYDGDTSNNTVTLDVNGSTPSDATKKFNQLTKQPQVRQLISKGNVNAKIHLNNEEIKRLKENSIKFTKKELTNFLFE